MVGYFQTPLIPKFRILLTHDGIVRRFLSVTLGTRSDGSLYLTFDRTGISEHSTYWTSEQSTPTEVTGGSNGFRMSYHTSGRVHSHDLTGEPQFNEPLFAVTQPNYLVTISIPSADRLDAYEEFVGSQTVVAVPNNQRLNFTILVCPSGFSANLPNIVSCANWEGLFELSVLNEGQLPKHVVPEGYERHFIFMQMQRGIFINQPTVRDDAFIRFHQKITGHQDLIIYGPNGSGEYLMVFAVPMRVTPIPIITPQGRDLVAHITIATNHYLRYQIRRTDGELIRAPVPVDATLDARL